LGLWLAHGFAEDVRVGFGKVLSFIISGFFKGRGTWHLSLIGEIHYRLASLARLAKHASGNGL